MERKHFPIIIFILFFVFLGIVGIALRSRNFAQNNTIFTIPDFPSQNLNNKKDTIKKFASDADFIALINESNNTSSREFSTTLGSELMMKQASSPQMNSTSDTLIERSSSTNVQVAGIDEPDIMKMDAGSIFYSKENQYRLLNSIDAPSGMGIQLQKISSTSIMPPQYEETNEILSVGALPPSMMKMQSSIPLNGEMLIAGKVLVIFSKDSSDGSLRLVGYSILNPSLPKKLWEVPFSKKTQKIAARLYQDSIYLVTSTSPTLPRPCPVPLIEGKMGMNVRCTDINLPSSRPISNSIYSVLRINPQTGGVEKTVSFVGQLEQSSVYMSLDSLYLSYQVEGNKIDMFYQFIAENSKLFPDDIVKKMKKLYEYDLSQSTKEIEMYSLLSQSFNYLDDGERLKQENQINNAFKSFINKYKRSFEYTGIIKVNNADLSIQAMGKVPGAVLNQFSFDEWKGDLRVATTIKGGNLFWGTGTTEQVNDVYILDKNLEMKGSVKDLGKTERIYSVRFIEDRGYVVTFRQTDPFYVLDLSNAYSPQLKGELKILGYSSYLHPLDTHLILGIGRENQVKLSLFDVSDPTNPKEVSRYDLVREYWSEAMDNSHAFLHDPKYKVIFLPGSRGGYILSYEGQSLSLVKALESPIVKRGLYLNDYLYIVSDSGIISFKEGSWEKIGELTYKNENHPIELNTNPNQSESIPIEIQSIKP